MGREERGYTIVELCVVVLIFSIVMTLISVSFSRIVTSSSQLVKSAETDIGGLIGLEVLRSDLELGGFGLPWSMPKGTAYTETGEGVMVPGYPATVASRFNDQPTDPPRAYVTGNNVGYNGSDYLVVKATALGLSATARSWSYLNYSPDGKRFKPSKAETELVAGRSDRVVVLQNISTSVATDRRLVNDDTTGFTLVYDPPVPLSFRPRSGEDTYLVYGVAPERKVNGKDVLLTYPYNRADYFIKRPDSKSISSACAANTGVLYKVVINQSKAGDLPTTSYPLLDCVADMQAIFYLDTNGDGSVDSHLSELADPNPYTAREIREQLKEIRVYILAQQGKRDTSYQYPLDEMPIVVGDAGLDRQLGRVHGSTWSDAAMSRLDPQWRQYHWKIYTIVVRPRNL